MALPQANGIADPAELERGIGRSETLDDVVTVAPVLAMMAPLVPLDVCCRSDPGTGAELRARSADGGLAMQATATFR